MRSFLVITFIGFSLVSNSQIVIDNTIDATEAVNDILLGQGIAASNITYSGDDNQLGSFNSNGSNMVISEGLVLATGNCNLTSSSENDNPGSGGNNQEGMTAEGGNWDVTDQDLESLSGQDHHDAAVLEFDFIPLGDSIKFSFVFGSEEYLEFIDGGVNDAFGFFLSGPGLNGPYENNAVNLALVPGTNIPISIDTVNDEDNSAFFIDNSELNSDPNIIELDGYTVPMLAEAQVECGETYHIKIVIADGGDTSLDSAVFLEASSFSSNQIEVNLESEVGFLANDSTAYEGCGSPVISFSRSGNLDQEQTVNLTVSGTATLGQDYTGIQNQVVFPIGAENVELVIDIINDQTPEPLEFLTIEFLELNTCGNVEEQSMLTIYIVDPPAIEVITQDLQTECGTPISLAPQISGGVGDLSVTWSDNEMGTPREVSPGTTTLYEFTVTDECNQMSPGEIEVVVPIEEPIVFDPISTAGMECGTQVTLSASATGGNGGVISFVWTDNGNVIGNESTLTYLITGGSNLEVSAIDPCGNFETQILTFEVPPLDVIIEGPSEICLGQSANLNAIILEGSGDISYSWNNGEGSGANFSETIINTTTFTLSAFNQCGATDTESFTVNVNDVEASFTTSNFGTDLYNFQSTSSENANLNWVIDGESYSTESAIQYTPVDALRFIDVFLYATSPEGCLDSAFYTIVPEPILYIPNSFTPDHDGFNDVWKVVSTALLTYHIIIFDRDGHIVFESFDSNEPWNGSVNRGDYFVPDGIYPFIVKYSGANTEANELRGHITVLR